MSRWKLSSVIGFSLAAFTLTLPLRFLESAMLSQPVEGSSWSTVNNLNHNAFHLWRQDPFSRAGGALVTSFIPSASLLPQLLLLLVGTFLILRQIGPTRSYPPFTRWILSAIPTAAVPMCVGNDPVVIGAIAWLPLLSMVVFALLNASREGQAGRVIPLWIIALFVSIQSSGSGNQASIPVALVALGLALFVLEPSGARQHPLPTRAALLVAVVAALPALLATICTPLAQLPDYPKLSHVVPLSGEDLPFIPLVGAHYPVLTIDRDAVSALYALPSLFLVALAGALLLTFPRAARSHERPLLSLAFGAALCVMLDTVLPRDWSLQAPLSTVSRMLPSGSTVALTPIAVGLSAWLVGVAGISSSVRRIGLPVAVATLVTASIIPVELKHPPLVRLLASGDEQLVRALHSPSASIVRNSLRDDPLFVENLPRYRELAHHRMRDSANLGASYTLEPSTFEPPTPQSTRGRLRTNTGGQTGQELLTITLAPQSTIHGIEVSPGPFVSDFPRGVEVFSGSCDGSDKQQIAKFSSWQGALCFTKLGYPFWDEHNHVRVLFAKPVSAPCIFVKQIGRTRYDWSVERVKLLPAAVTP